MLVCIGRKRSKHAEAIRIDIWVQKPPSGHTAPSCRRVLLRHGKSPRCMAAECPLPSGRASAAMAAKPRLEVCDATGEVCDAKRCTRDAAWEVAGADWDPMRVPASRLPACCGLLHRKPPVPADPMRLHAGQDAWCAMTPTCLNGVAGRFPVHLAMGPAVRRFAVQGLVIWPLSACRSGAAVGVTLPCV